MDGACNTHGKDKCIDNLSQKNLKARDRLGVFGVDSWIILKWILEEYCASTLTDIGWGPITNFCDHVDEYSGNINGNV
jgi:hypothetical protein